MNIIEIKDLTHRFSNGAVGLDRIDLRVKAGEFVVVCGPNGSGKTTLLRHLNGLLLPESGSISISGLDVTENAATVRQLVGMVFQDADSQIVGETVFDDVAFGPENLLLSRDEIHERVTGALSAVGLGHLADQRPYLLSAGEKRRLAIAGVLAMIPRVIVFDEPFSNLDYPGIQQVLSQILSLHKTGHTIVVATHDLSKVYAYADRILLMRDGRIVRDGKPDQLLPEVGAFGVEKPCACRMASGVGS
jgi:biotin transport system ATP-binding protein